MTQPDASQGQPTNVDDELRDEEISDEEANEEIDFPPTVAPRVTVPAPRPAPVAPPPRASATADDTTPSVKVAIDKAADVLRELRGER